MRLTKIFANEPFKNSKNQRKEYIENELKDLSYIYRDPLTKVKFYLFWMMLILTSLALVWSISLFRVDGSVCGTSTGYLQDRYLLWLWCRCTVTVRSCGEPQTNLFYIFSVANCLFFFSMSERSSCGDPVMHPPRIRRRVSSVNLGLLGQRRTLKSLTNSQNGCGARFTTHHYWLWDRLMMLIPQQMIVIWRNIRKTLLSCRLKMRMRSL